MQRSRKAFRLLSNTPDYCPDLSLFAVDEEGAVVSLFLQYGVMKGTRQ